MTETAVAEVPRAGTAWLRPVVAAVAALALVWAAPAAALVLMAAATALAIFGRPERWLGVLSWLLPFHIIAVIVLFSVVGLPAPAVRVIAAWKEASVAGVLAVVLLGAFAGRRRLPPVHWVDLCALTLVTLALCFLAGTSLWVGRERPLGMQLYGFRDGVYFLGLYAVGRATADVADTDAPLRRLFAVGVVTSLIAIVERLFVTPDMLLLLGVSTYFSEFLGLSEYIAAEHGLPAAYFTAFGGVTMRRAGSVYMSGQGFAVPFLLIMPAATVTMLSRVRLRALPLLGYGLLWVGLLLTITRVTIVACLVQLFVLLVLFRRTMTASVLVGLAMAALGAASLAVPRLGAFVWQTLTWQTPSSGTHLADYERGITAMLGNPLGYGLGTADQTALRFDFVPLTFDNQYMKYGVELGVLGMLAYVLLLFGAGRAGLRAYRGGAPDGARLFGVTALAMVIGASLNDMTATLFNNPMFAYIFAWFIGTAVTLGQRAGGAASRVRDRS